YITTIWGYEGFIWDFNINKFLISIMLLAISTQILPYEFQKPSDLLLHIQFIFPIFFMLILYAAENLSSYYTIFSIFSFFLIVLFARYDITVPRTKLGKYGQTKVFYFFLLIFVFLVAILFITHKDYFNLNFAKVYDYRMILREVDTGIWGYVWFSLFPLLASFLLTMSIIHNKQITLVLLSLSLILVFALTSHKHFLFIPVTLVGLYWISCSKKPITLMLIILLGLSIISVILDKLWLSVWARALVINRLFLTPAQLNFFYYDFFSQNQMIFWTDTKWLLLDRIIDYPYSLPMPKVIGYQYFGNPETSANTGWLGSGYAHAGVIGILLYAAVLGVILKYIDYKSQNLGKRFIVTSFSPFISPLFFSSDLKTVFLTHGFLFYLLIIFFLKHKSAD
ncbi:MAG: hypothetical protein QXY64_04440, partial [Candidatus Bilamarchaeaceae archaeon]